MQISDQLLCVEKLLMSHCGNVIAMQRELSRFTRAYTASGWFTGVKSTVIVPATPDVVYSSLATDLHEVFTPMSVSISCFMAEQVLLS